MNRQLMDGAVLEVAPLKVRPGRLADFEAAFRRAQAIIASVPGYVSHELQRCLERPDEYVLLVRWTSLEAHEVNFRESAGYQEWKALLHGFYEPFPVVSHYESVTGAAGGQPLAAGPRESWIPRGFSTVTPNIIADNAEDLIAFLTRALGATERYRLTMASGKIAHCELKIGDSTVNVGESMEGWPARGLVAQLYVEDSDALFERAVAAGATVIMPMTDMFFGSREGRVADPFGNVWTIATLTEEVSPEDMQRRMTDGGY